MCWNCHYFWLGRQDSGHHATETWLSMWSECSSALSWCMRLCSVPDLLPNPATSLEGQLQPPQYSAGPLWYPAPSSPDLFHARPNHLHTSSLCCNILLHQYHNTWRYSKVGVNLSADTRAPLPCQPQSLVFIKHPDIWNEQTDMRFVLAICAGKWA